MSEYPAPPQAPAAPTYTSGPSGPRAGFWARFAALLIDGILLGALYGIVWAITNQEVGSAVQFLAGIAYFSYFEGGPTGQTIGKRALGIRVYDFGGSGQPIGYGRGIIRYLGRILASIPCLLGYFWMLWDKEKQCWQDKLATTVVVPVSAYPVQ